MVSKGDGSIWMIEKDLCRCCHAEGNFFNLATPNKFKQQEEIYSDMIRTCFDIEIDPVPGALCVPTYSICTNCVNKLREATTFKEKILKCEQKFYELLTSASITVPKQIKKEPAMDMEDLNDDMIDDMEYDMGNLNDNGDEESTEEPIEIQLKVESEEQMNEEQNQNSLRPRIPKTNILAQLLQAPKPAPKPKAKPKPRPKPNPKPRKPPKEKKEQKEKKEDTTEKKDGQDVKFIKTVTNGTTAWQCSDCGRSFKKRDLFAQHYKFVHLKQRPKLRSCHLCPEKVPTQYRPFHMEKVHGVPLPTCGACGKKFAFPNQVLRHQKIYHMGEKQFACAICEMKFISKTLLLRHSIIHTGLRPYQCNYCDKSFRWKKNLKTHIYMHLDVRKHVCHVCNESFVQQSSLKYHITKRHTEML